MAEQASMGHMTITGTLRWDTSVPEHHGWLLRSAALLDGAACIPSPDYYHTDADASEEELCDLIESTLRWEGFGGVQGLTLKAAHDESYSWAAVVEK